MKRYTVLGYLIETELLWELENAGWTSIPLTLDALTDIAESYNFWSRPVEDIDLDSDFYSVEDMVIVRDHWGIERCFDLNETETW